MSAQPADITKVKDDGTNVLLPSNNGVVGVRRDDAPFGLGKYWAWFKDGTRELIGGGGTTPSGIPTASGVYTPALTNGANVSSSLALQCQWMRVGSVVTVSGEVLIDATVINTTTILEMALPIASNFGFKTNCGGTFATEIAPYVGLYADSGSISGSAANNRAVFSFLPSEVATPGKGFMFSFTYLII